MGELARESQRDPHRGCGDSCRWLYRQTMQERDGSVMQSKWLDADSVALWLHAVLVQGRRPRRLVLQRIHSYAPAGRIDTLYDSEGACVT